MQQLEQLAERLLREGVAYRHVRRFIGELRDHYGTFDRAVLWSPRSKARARHAHLKWGPRPPTTAH